MEFVRHALQAFALIVIIAIGMYVALLAATYSVPLIDAALGISK